MGAFVDDVLFDSRQTVKDHSTRPSLDVVDGQLAHEESSGDGDSPAGA